MKKLDGKLLVGPLALFLLALVTAPQRAGAQPLTADAKLQTSYDFETDVAPWLALGDEAKIALSRHEGDFKNGDSALRFDYGVRGGKINLLILPTPLHGLDETRAVSFWVKTDYDATLTAIFGEHSGGRYAAMFYAPANNWQKVELSLADFILLRGKNDPEDLDGKLDLDQIEAFSLADLAQIFAATADTKAAALLGLKTGPHTLYLDDFRFGREDLAAPKTAATPKTDAIPKTDPIPKTVALETFSHPQLAWTPLGGASLKITTTDAPGRDPMRTMVAGYSRQRGALSGLIRRLPDGILKGATQLRFEAVSTEAATILLQFEENGGGKYQLSVHLDGGGFNNDITVDLANFLPADDSKDQNNRLDLGDVHQLGIFDITGLINTDAVAEAGVETTLSITNLRVITQKP